MLFCHIYLRGYIVIEFKATFAENLFCTPSEGVAF